jgi:hypothetical protein
MTAMRATATSAPKSNIAGSSDPRVRSQLNRLMFVTTAMPSQSLRSAIFSFVTSSVDTKF